MEDFISEDDLKTFEGWLRYQAVDPSTTSPDELAEWRRIFDQAMARCAASPEVGLMKFQPVPGEYRYAVAVREGVDLWLALWVRRSRKGEFFVMLPRADRDWDVHTSYHLDGTLHIKSYGDRVLSDKKQPLTGMFRGTVNLGGFSGYGPKGVEAICNPTLFSGVVEVAPGVLGPRHGAITVDLVEPGYEPAAFPWSKIEQQETFRDTLPWIVIRVGTLAPAE